jgi:pimeloyl-ACP methyl ester carboxylesterase
MNVTQKVFVKFSDGTQDRLLGWLLKTGLASCMPVFKTLFRSFEFSGAEPAELSRAFSRAGHDGQSLVDAFCSLGHEIRFLAQLVDEAGDSGVARELYFRATLYYLAADLFTLDRRQRAGIYSAAMPCFDRFRRLSTPPIEKIALDHPAGAVMAHFRTPNTAKGPHPAIVMLQGAETVKEWMVAFEDHALARGIATLTVDQPGWGESGLTGEKLLSAGDLETCAHLALDFLQRRRDINGEAVGVFGTGFGGLLAPYCAALEPRFSAVASLGAIFYAKEVWKALPAVLLRRIYRITGLKTPNELDEWFDQLRIEETLSQASCPALLVHGAKDEIVRPANAHALAAAMRGDVKVETVQGSDSLCTQFLFQWVADYIFDWFAVGLQPQTAAFWTSRTALAGEREAALEDHLSSPFDQRQVQGAHLKGVPST